MRRGERVEEWDDWKGGWRREWRVKRKGEEKERKEGKEIEKQTTTDR